MQKAFYSRPVPPNQVPVANTAVGELDIIIATIRPAGAGKSLAQDKVSLKFTCSVGP
jgi:hypothetical protein